MTNDSPATGGGDGDGDGDYALQELPKTDSRFGPPDRVTEALADPALGLLPTHEMPWPEFERLLMRVAREVQGLRAVKLFGNPGQSQGGLDVVGLNSRGGAEGVQGKRYQKFEVGDLDKAVAKFLKGKLAFPVERLAVGVSCEANEKKVVERLIELNQQHARVEIEIWDRSRLSELLRNRPDIVREFFGPVTASRFCVPHTVGPVEVPSPDAVGLADAVMAGPAMTGEVKAALDVATRTRAEDPGEALEHLLKAKRLLIDQGFPAHAAVLDETAVALLASLGRVSEAAALLLDRMWASLAEDRLHEADGAVRDLEKLAEGDAHPDAAAAAAVARAAVRIAQHPLGQLPAASELPADGPRAGDVAQLLLLAAETALAVDDRDWLAGAHPLLDERADSVTDVDAALTVRLELVAADATGEWSGLLARARGRAIDRALAALVLARHARYLAVRGGFADADAEWSEAVEQGCLAGLHTDAADWIYSRRQLAMRYRGLVDDVWHPLAAALNARPMRPRIAAAASSVREHALDAMHRGKPREAALRLLRLLRDEVVSGSWQGEHDARSLLASVYRDVGEPALAARDLILAGESKDAKALGENVGDLYIDVREHLHAPTYWTRATAFEFVAAQADILPDGHVAEILEEALGVLDDAAAGTLVDTPLFGPSVYLTAHTALGALGDRLTEDSARRHLAHLAPLAPTEPGRYRHTDDPHATACAAIARHHPELRENALDQLVTLFSRASHSVDRAAVRTIEEHLDVVQDRIEALAADGNTDARELLAAARPGTVEAEAAEAAAQDLLGATSSGPGLIAMGTGAVRASLLAMTLPPDRRADLVREQLRRARLPWENAHNRSEYLLAASNVTEGLAQTDVDELMPAALAEATEPAPSEADAMTANLNHPLGAMRMSMGHDTRPAAALLAARLARTQTQRAQARDAALRLIGADGNADYYVTRALQVLEQDLGRDAPFLAKQGWALRSLAAIAWVHNDSCDARLGAMLAGDPDARVRRALAEALSESDPSERTVEARATLAADPRHSVRMLLNSGRD